MYFFFNDLLLCYVLCVGKNKHHYYCYALLHLIIVSLLTDFTIKIWLRPIKFHDRTSLFTQHRFFFQIKLTKNERFLKELDMLLPTQLKIKLKQEGQKFERGGGRGCPIFHSKSSEKQKKGHHTLRFSFIQIIYHLYQYSR